MTTSNLVFRLLAESITVILGILGCLALVEVRKYLKAHHQEKALKIVDYLTDTAVQLAATSLSGSSGELKRKAAIDYVTKSLDSRGIKASSDEILAGIEDGYNKLKSIQAEHNLTICEELTSINPIEVPQVPHISDRIQINSVTNTTQPK